MIFNYWTVHEFTTSIQCSLLRQNTKTFLVCWTHSLDTLHYKVSTVCTRFLWQNFVNILMFLIEIYKLYFVFSQNPLFLFLFQINVTQFLHFISASLYLWTFKTYNMFIGHIIFSTFYCFHIPVRHQLTSLIVLSIFHVTKRSIYVVFPIQNLVKCRCMAFS